MILGSVFNIFNIWKIKFFQVLEKLETLTKIITKCTLMWKKFAPSDKSQNLELGSFDNLTILVMVVFPNVILSIVWLRLLLEVIPVKRF